MSITKLWMEEMTKISLHTVVTQRKDLSCSVLPMVFSFLFGNKVMPWK